MLLCMLFVGLYDVSTHHFLVSHLFHFLVSLIHFVSSSLNVNVEDLFFFG